VKCREGEILSHTKDVRERKRKESEKGVKWKKREKEESGKEEGS
jgi:hypothetical protein